MNSKSVLKRPVFVIGFMGSGKSSVAATMSKKFGLPSIELDAYIEQSQGQSISQIFDEVGDAGFREIETAALADAASRPAIISCGGGIVTRPENRKILQEHGFTVCLDVSADEAASRIGDFRSRPNFQSVEHASRLLQERHPLYEACADAMIDTNGKTIDEVADELFCLLESKGIIEMSRH